MQFSEADGMTPYEMYMKSLSTPAGPMGQNGEVYGQRDAVMRKGMRSPAAMGSGMPFGLAPTPGIIEPGGPRAVPGTPGAPARLDGSAMDTLWGGGGNSDADIMGNRNRPPMEERVRQMVGPQQSRDSVMGRPGGAMGGGGPMDLGGMAEDSRKPKFSGMLTGDDPALKFGGLAGLLQGMTRSPQMNMAAPVNGGHFAGTGAGGLFNKGGLLGMLGR
jgi:hypothetical protein